MIYLMSVPDAAKKSVSASKPVCSPASMYLFNTGTQRESAVHEPQLLKDVLLKMGFPLQKQF